LAKDIYQEIRREWALSLFFQPRRFVGPWWFEFNVELLEGLFQLLLVSSKVGRDGIMEQQKLLVHHFYL